MNGAREHATDTEIGGAAIRACRGAIAAFVADGGT